VRIDKSGHSNGGRHQRVAAVLDRPQPHHCELLGRLGDVERRVVGLHGEDLPAGGHGVADDAVVGDLEADHVADPGRPELQHAGPVAGHEVGAHQVDLVGDLARDRPERMYSANGTGMLLDVALPRPGSRSPHQDPR
jgi:hypothetical protein